MGHVQNVSERTLGWAGMVFAPGDIMEVRDGLAEQMQKQTGGQFKEITVAEASQHRHRYEEGNDVCTVDGCDHVKRGSPTANGETSGSGSSGEGENGEGSGGADGGEDNGQGDPDANPEG